MKSVLFKYNIFYIGIVVLLIINCACLFVIFQNNGCKNHRDMVVFLDVGQGDAIYIENKYGQNLLVDTGNKDTGVLNQIHKVTSCNSTKIQNLLLTHPDQDHIGEAYNLIAKGLVSNVIHNGFIDMNQPDESQTENNLEQIIKDKGVRTQNMTTNNSVDLKGFDFEFLFPEGLVYRDLKKGQKVDDNDFSIVFKLTYGTTSFMLTGDAPIKVEDQIMKKYCPSLAASSSCPILASTVLKLGHHGSKNSSGSTWLQKVNATDYIVSAGLNNKYHHPNEETLNRIKALNKKDSRVRESFVEGNIVYLLD